MVNVDCLARGNQMVRLSGAVRAHSWVADSFSGRPVARQMTATVAPAGTLTDRATTKSSLESVIESSLITEYLPVHFRPSRQVELR